MVAIAFAAARTLKLSTGGADIFGNLDAAIGKTTTITKIGGSTFDTVDTRNPLMWPWAIFRTLTRPFPTEVTNPLALLTAIESNVFLVALVATIWRTGIRRLVATFRQAPYLAYTTTCTLLSSAI